MGSIRLGNFQRFCRVPHSVEAKGLGWGRTSIKGRFSSRCGTRLVSAVGPPSVEYVRAQQSAPQEAEAVIAEEPYVPPSPEKADPMAVARTAEKRSEVSVGLAGAKPSVFIDWKVYKKKAALSLSPIRPTATKYDNGSGVISKQGSLLLEFAEATGSMQYGWTNKQVFALTVLELAEILASPDESHRWVHDPNMKTAERGMMIKTLHLNPGSDSGWFFHLSTQRQDEAAKKISVPLTPGEFEMFKVNAQFLIPRLFGLDQYF